MFSARSEFLLGLLAAVVTVCIGTMVGAVAAYFGGWIDMLLMRLADIMIMMPGISILIVLSALIEVGHLELALLIGILSGFGGTGVVLKSQALSRGGQALHRGCQDLGRAGRCTSSWCTSSRTCCRCRSST